MKWLRTSVISRTLWESSFHGSIDNIMPLLLEH